MATDKKKSALTAAAAKKDATLLLTRDHREVSKLFKQYEKLAKAEALGSERQTLAGQLRKLLTIHAAICRSPRGGGRKRDVPKVSQGTDGSRSTGP